MKTDDRSVEQLHARLARLAVTCVVAGKYEPSDVIDGLLLACAAAGGAMNAAEIAVMVERKSQVLCRELRARDAPGSAAMH